jgi:hypothetical protein
MDKRAKRRSTSPWEVKKMKKTWMRIPVMVATLSLVLLTAPTLAFAQNVYGDAAVRAHQQGHERGYHDGFGWGRDTLVQERALVYNTYDYLDARDGYHKAFGPFEEYRRGYREGYREGADIAYYGANARVERAYGATGDRATLAVNGRHGSKKRDYQVAYRASR